MKRTLMILVALLPVFFVSHAMARTRTVHAAAPRPVTAVGCEEHEAWVDGDARAVAAALPKAYTPLTDASGNPVVFARAEHCAAVNVGGKSRPATLADWGVVVNSPDGFGCASGAPVIGGVKGDLPPICNWYPLALVSDDPGLIAWLRDGTPSLPVSYTPKLTYRLGSPDALGRTAFHFSTPRQSRASFSLDDVSSFNPGPLSLRGGYWFATPNGTVKLDVSTDDLTSGRADTTLRAAPGSPLARLMGATQRSSAPPYEEFGVIRVGHGVLRKQLFGPPRANESTQRFAGSCSLQGTVTFAKPVTNTQVWTNYGYSAIGSCSGKLNGRQVSSLPVRLRHTGRSYASCMQGLAFPPSTGTITFPDRTSLAYTFDFTTDLTEVDGTIYGTRSGQAHAHATFLTQRTSPTVSVDCSTGGVRRVPMDLSLTTQQDLVSGSASGQ